MWAAQKKATLTNSLMNVLLIAFKKFIFISNIYILLAALYKIVFSLINPIIDRSIAMLLLLNHKIYLGCWIYLLDS